MIRTPAFAPPELPAAPRQEFTLSYELVTPMYGGGTHTHTPDLDQPVRASAIRGQLRQWWRLVARSDFDSPAALRRAEFELWGGPDKKEPKASRILLSVRNVQRAQAEPWATYEKRPNGLYKSLPTAKPWANAAYVLFPAQGKASGSQIEQPPHSLIKSGMTFDLVIRMDRPLSERQQQQLWEAVRWWSQFGGLGARTRRGLGAIWLKGTQGLEQTPQAGALTQPITPAQAQQKGCQLVLQNRGHNQAPEAWTNAVHKLRDLRQGVNLGRNPGQQPNRPGRSRWPEPDSIRRLTNRADRQHAPVHPAGNAFPRAAFGLPIIFHFQSGSDPSDTSLNPVVNGSKKERMASPVILRPYRDAQNKWRAAALLLPHEHVRNLRLDLSGTPAPYWRDQQAGQVRPIDQHNAQTALQAFMNYFRDN